MDLRKCLVVLWCAFLLAATVNICFSLAERGKISPFERRVNIQKIGVYYE